MATKVCLMKTVGNTSICTTRKNVCLYCYNLKTCVTSAIQGQHEAYYKSRCNQTIHEPSKNTVFTFLANELINVEVSHKVCMLHNCVVGQYSPASSIPKSTPTDYLQMQTCVRSNAGPIARASIHFGFLSALLLASHCSPIPKFPPRSVTLEGGHLFLHHLLVCHLYKTGRMCGHCGTLLLGA